MGTSTIALSSAYSDDVCDNVLQNALLSLEVNDFSTMFEGIHRVSFPCYMNDILLCRIAEMVQLGFFSSYFSSKRC